MPTIQLTEPAKKLAASEDIGRIKRALKQFPEFDGSVITVGSTSSYLGLADSENMIVRFNFGKKRKRRRPPTFHTIGHELTHLLQHARFRNAVPQGEVTCDIWTLARSKLFCDEAPYYLWGPWARSNWLSFAPRVHELCKEAIEVRKTNRRYIMWLNARIKEEFCQPVRIPW